MTKGKNFCRLEKKWCKFCKRKGCTFVSGFPQIWETVKSCPKRENKRTISLFELLKTVDFDEMMARMLVYHPTEDTNIKGYAKVYKRLLETKPVRTNIELAISKITEDNAVYYDVYGIENGTKYGIDFVPWDEWLYMNIDKDTYDNYTKEDIVALSLWEMTFHGFEEEIVKESLDDLYDRIKYMKDGTKTNS